MPKIGKVEGLIFIAKETIPQISLRGGIHGAPKEREFKA
jgi:hypothetical protein